MSNLKKYHVSKNLMSGILEQGSFNSGTGEPNDLSTRVRTTAVTLSAGQYRINAGGAAQSVVMYVYETDNTFLPNESVISWVNIPTTMTVTGDRNVRFAFRKNDNTNITPSEVNNVMLNAGTETLPYEPYSADVWHDLQPKIYASGTWTDSAGNPKKYSNGSWS